MVDHLFTLLMLIILQAVLGFDNLLYISIESKRAPLEKQSYVRRMGIGLAIVFRIVLLFLLLKVISVFQEPFEWLTLNTSWIEFKFNLVSLITLFGGAFIIYTAIKEIWHMMNIKLEGQNKKKKNSVGKVIGLIVFMNLVFSFDSILSAMALAKDEANGGYVEWVMVVAIVVSGILMIWLADKVSAFLEKNKLYQVLGLFILFIVGIMLVTEGGHEAHIKLFGQAIEAMSKTTFYFVIAILVVIDMVQGRYQKRLLAQKAHADALLEKEEGVA